jgi:hypothetical protein
MHCSSGVALDLGELRIGNRQCIMPTGIEVGKLVDTVEDFSHEFSDRLWA